MIISGGGGIYAQPNNNALVAGKVIAVYLKGDPDMLFERIKNKTHRPLLNKPNSYEIFLSLFAQRQEIYEKADIIFNITDGSKDENAEALYQLLQQHRIFS